MGGVVLLALCCGGIGIAALNGDTTTTGNEAAVASSEPTETRQQKEPYVPAPVAETEPPEAAQDDLSPAPPVTVRMPDLVGLNAAVAQDKLERLGWPPEQIELGSQDEMDTFVILPANWTVTKQSEKAGSKVEPGGLIVLTCTKKR
ncbi:PASTA domain-containing protein [Asanoa sp. WMMD1127]|uniref:PASTA domain-containing protein n=1 Tax=Asanoa sp. WMMD1127 TaxID=3016107 RepID=UPI00241737F7|nr:PASTA domain-containing protein [Asanoa sp. WMMD1127]MDG4821917.1 PASTA domain-containing protein [Asanoa sp. WMMD1127]